MSSKQEIYEKLVEKRKRKTFSVGLKNPSEIKGGIYDKNSQLSPWSKWQGNLDAKILVIGQDWGNIETYVNQEGGDIQGGTNDNLKELFQEIGIEIGTPEHPIEAKVFLTNAVLGLKTGSMTSPVKRSWIKQDAEAFLRPLIDIIKPEIIIALGRVAYDALRVIYLYLREDTLENLLAYNPQVLSDSTLVFAMFHCSPQGHQYNRSLNQQKEDWQKIK